MELERIKRKITALENKNQVNYASVSGTTYSITKNGTELSIDKDGYVVCNNTFIATNVKADNEERLKKAEEELDGLDDKYALKDHDHDERYAMKEHGHDFNVIQDELTLNVNNVNITDNLTDKYALKDHDHDDKYALKDHNHDDKYALKDHNHDDKYSSKTHNHDAYYSSKTHNHDAYYAAKDHTHTEFDNLHVDNFDCNGDGHVYLNNSTAVMQLKPQSITFTDMTNSSAVQINKESIKVNGKNVSLENHTHNYDDKYALKGHNHDDKYALKDHTHSDIQDLIAAYEKRIVFLELALQIANKYQVFWEDNGTQYVNESDIFDIIVGYYFTFFKLKDRFIGTKVFLTINEEEYPGENNYSIKYVNYQYGKSDPQTFGSNHSLALRGDKKYCKFECLYENIYPGDIPLFMNVSFIYGSMSKNYKLSIYQNDYPDDYYDKFFNL